jgi:hypothetical protein
VEVVKEDLALKPEDIEQLLRDGIIGQAEPMEEKAPDAPS